MGTIGLLTAVAQKLWCWQGSSVAPLGSPSLPSQASEQRGAGYTLVVKPWASVVNLSFP